MTGAGSAGREGVAHPARSGRATNATQGCVEARRRRAAIPILEWRHLTGGRESIHVPRARGARQRGAREARRCSGNNRQVR